MKTVLTAGIFVTLVVPSMTALAAGEVKSNNESEAVRLMEQTRAYVQQQNQYRSYAAADTSQQQTQDQTRSMVGADNETGQGELNRERIQHRDGSGTSQQYNRSMTGSDNEMGKGDMTRDRMHDGSGTGDQNKYGGSGGGGGNRH